MLTLSLGNKISKNSKLSPGQHVFVGTDGVKESRYLQNAQHRAAVEGLGHKSVALLYELLAQSAVLERALKDADKERIFAPELKAAATRRLLRLGFWRSQWHRSHRRSHRRSHQRCRLHNCWRSRWRSRRELVQSGHISRYWWLLLRQRGGAAGGKHALRRRGRFRQRLSAETDGLRAVGPLLPRGLQPEVMLDPEQIEGCLVVPVVLLPHFRRERDWRLDDSWQVWRLLMGHGGMGDAAGRLMTEALPLHHTKLVVHAWWLLRGMTLSWPKRLIFSAGLRIEAEPRDTSTFLDMSVLHQKSRVYAPTLQKM